MNNNKNRQKWIKIVEETLEAGGRSKTTIIAYVYAINRFLNCFSEQTKISNFNEKKILDYLKKEFIQNQRKATTYNFNLSVIKYFFSVCFEKELNKRLLPKAKIAKRYPKIMEIKTFIYLINKEKNFEHKCFLLLGFCCGLRASEVASIKIEDIDSKNHKLRVIGKGNKERYTILPDIVIKFLRAFYRLKHMTIKEGYLFKGINGEEHISEKTVSNYFTELANLNNLPDDITFHTLRHSFATHYLKNDGDLLILKDLLGHSSLSTTIIYVHLAKDFNNLRGIRY